MPKLKLRTIIILGLGTIICAHIIIGFIGIPIEYSHGERTGTVVKLSKKGILFKTWEGEMNIGSMSTNGGGMAVPTVWNFSIIDEELGYKIQNIATSGKRITLIYSQKILVPFWKGSTNYLIINFKCKRKEEK